MNFVTVRQSVRQFVDDFIRSPSVHAMIDEWRIEESTIVSIISDHLHALGIYYIEPHLRQTIEQDILFQLNHSKQILEEVRKAKELEYRRSSRNRIRDSF